MAAGSLDLVQELPEDFATLQHRQADGRFVAARSFGEFCDPTGRFLNIFRHIPTLAKSLNQGAEFVFAGLQILSNEAVQLLKIRPDGRERLWVFRDGVHAPPPGLTGDTSIPRTIWMFSIKGPGSVGLTI